MFQRAVAGLLSESERRPHVSCLAVDMALTKTRLIQAEAIGEGQAKAPGRGRPTRRRVGGGPESIAFRPSRPTSSAQPARWGCGSVPRARTRA